MIYDMKLHIVYAWYTLSRALAGILSEKTVLSFLQPFAACLGGPSVQVGQRQRDPSPSAAEGAAAGGVHEVGVM